MSDSPQEDGPPAKRHCADKTVTKGKAGDDPGDDPQNSPTIPNQKTTAAAGSGQSNRKPAGLQGQASSSGSSSTANPGGKAGAATTTKTVTKGKTQGDPEEQLLLAPQNPQNV